MACKIKSASKKYDEMIDNLFDKMGEKLSGWDKHGLFVASETQNMLHDVSSEFRLAQSALYEQARRARDILGSLTAEESKKLVRALNGDASPDNLSTATRKLYDTFRKEIDANADALVASGMLKSKDRIQDYLKRYYTKYVEQMGIAGKIIFNKKFKARDGSLTLDQRIVAGMIEDASVVIPNTILDQKLQLLRAKNLEKLELLFGEDSEKPGYVQVPTQEMGGGVMKYGALSGKWVKKEIFDAINDTTSAAQAIGLLEKYWYPIVDHIKQNVTIKNPVTHLYNIGSNIQLAAIRGDLAALAKVLAMPQDKYKKLIDTANSMGLNTMLNDMQRPDAQMLRSQNRPLDAVLVAWQNIYMAQGSKVGEKVRAMYEWEDKIFKLAALYRGLEKFAADNKREPTHGETKKIFDDANGAYVDYSTPLGFIPRVLDKSGLFPFLHYSVKATPAVAKMMLKNPLKAALFISALSMMGASTIGSKNDEEENGKPFWAADKYNLLFAKEYTSLGNGWFFNSGRLVPGMKLGGINFGNANEHGEFDLSLGFVGGLSNIAQGKDPLGHTIGGKYDSLAGVIYERIKTVAKNYAPPLTLGRYAQGAAEIATAKPYIIDKKGMTVPNPNAPKNSYKEPMTLKELGLRAVGVRKFDAKKEEDTKRKALASKYRAEVKDGMAEGDAAGEYGKAALELGIDPNPPHKKGHGDGGGINIEPHFNLMK